MGKQRKFLTLIGVAFFAVVFGVTLSGTTAWAGVITGSGDSGGATTYSTADGPYGWTKYNAGSVPSGVVFPSSPSGCASAGYPYVYALVVSNSSGSYKVFQKSTFDDNPNGDLTNNDNGNRKTSGSLAGGTAIPGSTVKSSYTSNGGSNWSGTDFGWECGGSPDSPPTGSISHTCNSSGAATVKFTFSDPDGATTAYYQLGGSSSSYPHHAVSSGGTATVAASNTVSPGYSVHLHVNDNGGSDDKGYDKTIVCNHPPSGTISVSCSSGTATITYTFSDPDATTDAYTYAGTGSTSVSEFSTVPGSGWTHRTSSGATQTISSANTYGTYNVYLYVKDSGSSPDGDGKYHRITPVSGVKCDHKATVGVNAPTCSASGSVTGSASDPDKSTNQLTVTIKSGTTTLGTVTTTGTTHTYSWNRGANGDWASLPITVTATDIQPDSPSDSSGPYNGTATAAGNLGPCAQVTCGANSLGGTLPWNVSTSFTVTVNVSNVSAQPSGTGDSFYWAVKNDTTGAVTGYSSAARSSSASSSTSLVSNSISYIFPSSGTYSLIWYWTWPTDSAHEASNGTNPAGTHCGDTATPTPIYAGNQSYFSVLGGDITAGPGFGSSCTTQSSSIIGYNTKTTYAPNYYGAGGQLAALVSGSLNPFTSGLNNGRGDSVSKALSSGAGHGSDLSFANTTGTTGAGVYGGSYRSSGAGKWCLPDYYNAASHSSTANPGTLSLTGKTGDYSYTGNLTITGGTIAAGTKLIIRVNGNVAITGDISYAAYSSARDIPRFELIVNGHDIYVGTAVHQLHGIYIAQPAAGTGGTFHTCSSSFTADKTNADCAIDMTVDGSVSANKLDLGRTYGTFTGGGGTASHVPAETFQYGPETWLPDAANDGVPAVPSVQAITSLPPIL